jgi:hypothetical protein
VAAAGFAGAPVASVTRPIADDCGGLMQVNNLATLVSAIEASSSMPATKLGGGN